MSTVFTPYSLGLAFSSNRQEVLLIKKNRWAWMAGHLNGIGGLVKSDEVPEQTLVRKSREEAGIEIGFWQHVIDMQFTNSVIVSVFSAFTDAIYEATQQTDERVVQCWVPGMNTILDYGNEPSGNLRYMPDLYWLIPLCLRDRLIVGEDNRRRLGSHILHFDGEQS